MGIVKGKSNKVVSSKIEITTPSKPAESESKLSNRTVSMYQYRLTIKEASVKIKEFSMKLFDSENLLSVKMALMMVVRDVEVMMKERRD
jgi:hypothetical protein